MKVDTTSTSQDGDLNLDRNATKNYGISHLRAVNRKLTGII